MDQPEQISKIPESRIKKELLRKKEKQEIKEKLRSKLPVLNAQEIRRYRLPYHEAILADLLEIDCSNSAEFIRQLIELQEETRKKFGPGTIVYLRPRLIFSKKDLDFLFKSLSKAENAHKQEDYITEWDELLMLACTYAFGDEDWWWLGEQLLFQCISIDYEGCFEKHLAMTNYIFGRYLVKNSKKLETGRHYLEMSREIATGKSWTCKKILPKIEQDTIFIESCILIYTALIEEARMVMKYHPAKAIDLCTLARKRAAEACDHLGEFKSLILKGQCELLIDDSMTAIATFTKALMCATRRKSNEGICEAKIRLALAFLK